MRLRNLALVPLLIGLAACNQVNSGKIIPPTQALSPSEIVSSLPATSPASLPTQLPTTQPDRLLSICLVSAPRSLFLYAAASSSEKDVLQAIYDGPIDYQGFSPAPVILQKLPSLPDGDAALQAVQVSPGGLIVDADGDLANLGEGVRYRPSGCTASSCAQVYTGTVTVQMDQLVLQFKLLPGLQWSDGAPLTAADSVYSYEVARSLYPAALPDLVSRTGSYQAVDGQTVEWVGVPGFVDAEYASTFFSPLPQHAWSAIPVTDLPTNAASSQKPLGWGPYVIDEWVTGDHISLHANPLYFRARQGLPYFDSLVYRFVSGTADALSAVQSGECDLADVGAGLESQAASLQQLQEKKSISLAYQASTAWDLLAFDISPLNPKRPAFFASKAVRQAVALCIDRQALVDQLSAGQMQVADSYLPPGHPDYSSAAKRYAFDPQAAADLLASAGWIDADSEPATPRIAQGVSGISDGTPFIVDFLTADDPEHQAAAGLIQAGLANCGIQAHVDSQPVQQYLAAGPDGPVFGRDFDLAQFAWTTSAGLPCSLFSTREIPGEYPAAPNGWGGMNAGGYSNPDYDHACLDALYSLPGTPQHSQEVANAQAIFAEDLPALPLYWHYRLVIARPDLCGLPSHSMGDNILSNLEVINYAEDCVQ